MTRICENCGKGGMVVQWRSHSNIATKHKQQVNLQIKRIDGIRKRICAKCIKRMARKAEKVAA